MTNSNSKKQLASDSSESTMVNVSSNTSQGEHAKMNPLPYPQFYILLCVRLVEPIAFTMVFPFMFEVN
jgi:hypothetical protein